MALTLDRYTLLAGAPVYLTSLYTQVQDSLIFLTPFIVGCVCMCECGGGWGNGGGVEGKERRGKNRNLKYPGKKTFVFSKSASADGRDS
jgi:hypothetical protein